MKTLYPYICTNCNESCLDDIDKEKYVICPNCGAKNKVKL